MKTFQVSLALMTIAAFASPVDAQNYRARGTRQGAVAGAIIGGIIGNQNNETAAGVIVGGLVGGVAGRAIGTQQQRRQYSNGFGSSHSYGSSFYRPQALPVQQHYVPQIQYYHQPAFVPQHYGGGYGRGCQGGW